MSKETIMALQIALQVLLACITLRNHFAIKRINRNCIDLSRVIGLDIRKIHKEINFLKGQS